MRYKFLTAIAVGCMAMVVAAGSEVDLLAKCRCDGCNCSRGGGGARRAARQERRAAKRGMSSQSVTPNGGGSGYNPYGGDGINIIGAAAPAASGGRLGKTGVDEQGKQYRVTDCWVTASGAFEQRCYGTPCVTVPVPATPQAKQESPKPQPDPEFKKVAPDSARETPKAEKDENAVVGEAAADAGANPPTNWFPPGVISGT